MSIEDRRLIEEVTFKLLQLCLSPRYGCHTDLERHRHGLFMLRRQVELLRRDSAVGKLEDCERLIERIENVMLPYLKCELCCVERKRVRGDQTGREYRSCDVFQRKEFKTLVVSENCDLMRHLRKPCFDRLLPTSFGTKYNDTLSLPNQSKDVL